MTEDASPAAASLTAYPPDSEVTSVRSRVARFARRWWSAGLVGAVVVALVVGAFLAPPVQTTDLHLHDATVYVVKQNGALLGQLNDELQDLASASQMADPEFDVLQEGRTVIVSSPASQQIQQFDPTTQTLGQSVSLPDAANFAMNDGMAAVVSRRNGAVWFSDVASVLSFDYTQQKAQLDLGENALVAVTSGGNLIGLSLRDSSVVHYTADGQRTAALPFTLDVTDPNVALSAIGERAAVLDRTRQQVWIEGVSNPLIFPDGSNASTAQLAPPAPETALGGGVRAVVATATGLIGVQEKRLVSLSGSAQSAGTPTVPLIVGDCVYGVVGTNVVKTCGSGRPQIQAIPDLRTDATLTLRANRDVVVLNDSRSGDVWLIDHGMKLVNDWERALPPGDSQEPTPDDRVVPTDPDRSGENRPPTAVDDTLAAREGRSTVLPVLDNDSDPDGDILAITGVSAVDDSVQVALIRGGAGMQVTVASGATGARSFSYTIDDGRGGTASARVTLTLLPGQEQHNSAPVQWRNDALVVPLNSQTTKRVLLDWRDPDGDDLVLTDAKVVDTDDEVSFTPDGTLTFTDVGKTPGIKTVAVTVFDGRDYASGQLLVDAREPTDVAPQASGDFATTTTGSEIEIKPLLNDLGSRLTLMDVEAAVPAGPTVTPDYASNSFRFSADAPGTYYVGYKVSSGPWSFGLVRVDVIDKPAENRPPIAARDVALITHGGSVTIDPLINDEDPDGDVLVVQTYTSAPGLTVQMRDRHLMTITETVSGNVPITLTYVVSDGIHNVNGTIVVIPSNPIGEVRPIAVPDDVKVRVNDTVTVKPLANDYSPIGLDLTMTRLVDAPTGAWLDADRVRFVSGATPGVVTVIYELKDSLGRTASSQLRITVVSADAPNQAPVPELVTGRVLTGSKTRIQVPLQNTDPNGDTVRLVGLASGPRLGRVTQVGPTWLEYEAFTANTGTDSFRYLVTDASGAQAVGEVRIGVIKPSEVNTDPTAVDDEVVSRPGRTVTVRPLANDFDVDGDTLSWVAGQAVTFPFPTTTTSNSGIQFTLPDEAGRWVGTYSVRDARGAVASGAVRIVSDPAAPLAAPIVADDMVSPAEVFARDWVEVPVLANDYDPDADRSALTVSIPAYDTQGGPAAEVVQTADGPKVRVPIGDRLSMLRYQVTDADGLSAYGFVMIPGRTDAVPSLKDPGVTLTVQGGDPLRINVAELVQGTRGRTVRLSSADKVTGASGQAKMESPQVASFQAPMSYSGPAAIVFEVVEDSDAGGSGARTATISIPITVTKRPDQDLPDQDRRRQIEINQPPVASEIDIALGAGEPETVTNLQTLVTDPEGDSFSFGRFSGEVPPGITWSASGGQITASAGITTATGTQGQVTAEVTDSRGAVGKVTVLLTVKASTRPKTSVTDDQVPDANKGQSVTVPVLANDTSSLVDTSLTVIGAAIESGEGSVSFTASSVTVVPQAVGVMRVRYQVEDATKDPGRVVEGRIVLNVRGVPGAPGVPRAMVVGDSMVTAEWTSALDNGLPVQKYIVTAAGNNGSTVTQDCPTTTCDIVKLTNGVKYILTVVGVNELGAGEVSATSAEMMPNVRPEKPQPITAAFGPGATGKQLHLSWTAPVNRGTPLTGYEVQLDGGATVSLPGDATSYTWTGLTNGVDYTFLIRAKNDAGWSDWSDRSVPEHPSEPATAPQGITSRDTGADEGGAIRVEWNAPASDNGAAVERYRVYAGGSAAGATNLLGEVPAGQGLTWTAAVPNGQDLYFAVSAVNRSGESAPVATQTAVRAFAGPTANGAPTVTAGNSSATVTMGAPDLNGSVKVSRWVVTWSGGGSRSVAPRGDNSLSTEITGLVNGTGYSFWVTPYGVNSSGDEKAGRTSAGSGPQTPFGNPGQPTPPSPTGSASSSNGSDFRIDVNVGTFGALNGNDPSDLALEVNINDGGFARFTPGSTTAVNFPASGGPIVTRVVRRDGTRTGDSLSGRIPARTELSHNAQGEISFTMRYAPAWASLMQCSISGANLQGNGLIGGPRNENNSATFVAGLTVSPVPAAGTSSTVTCSGSGTTYTSTFTW